MGSKKKIEIASEEETRKYAAPADAGQEEHAPPDASDKPESPPAEKTLSPEEQLENLRRQVEESKDKFLRAKADFQNLQRRSQQERQDAVRYANADFAKSLLAVLDDFERTFDAADADNATSDSVVQGVRLIYDSLKKVLTDNGVTEILTESQPFDPRLHEAVMQQPSDEHPNMTILQTLQKGYHHHDRVLRPAKVVVSKSAEQNAPSSDSSSGDAESSTE